LSSLTRTISAPKPSTAGASIQPQQHYHQERQQRELLCCKVEAAERNIRPPSFRECFEQTQLAYSNRVAATLSRFFLNLAIMVHSHCGQNCVKLVGIIEPKKHIVLKTSLT
jgi:hypothetical protein